MEEMDVSLAREPLGGPAALLEQRSWPLFPPAICSLGRLGLLGSFLFRLRVTAWADRGRMWLGVHRLEGKNGMKRKSTPRLRPPL